MRAGIRTAIALILLASGLSARPAIACMTFGQVQLADVKYADTVLIGRIDKYHIVRDEAFRRKMLAQPNLPASLRRIYSDPKGSLMGDYAEFDIVVSKMLKGRAVKRVRVTWQNSTFGIPETLADGPCVFALRAPGGPIPPLRGPSGTVIPDADMTAMTILQAPCSGPFMFGLDSAQARDLQAIVAPSQ